MRFMLIILVAAVNFALGSPAFAATPPCTGVVVIGEGETKIVTSVPNRSVGVSGDWTAFFLL